MHSRVHLHTYTRHSRLINRYDTLRVEEPFFSEAFLFHTITIDEGHRLKNDASSVCAVSPEHFSFGMSGDTSEDMAATHV